MEEGEVVEFHLLQFEMNAVVTALREGGVEVFREGHIESGLVFRVREPTAEMRHLHGERATGLQDAVQFLHHQEGPVEVLEHMRCEHMVEAVVLERIGEGVQIVLHVDTYVTVEVHVHIAILEVLPAAEVEFAWRVGGHAFRFTRSRMLKVVLPWLSK